MLKHRTLDQLHALGLHGMAKAFVEIGAGGEAEGLGHHEWLGLLLDREASWRRDKRLAARLRIAAGLVAERRRQPALAHAGRADERQIVVGLDPFSLGELLEQRAVETTRAAIIDVLDGLRTGSISPARACAEPASNKIKKLDQLASPMTSRRRRPDEARVGANAIDRPVFVAAMAGRHMLRHGRVLAIASHPHMRGDPVTLEEDLDGPRGQPHVDIGAGEAVGHAVVMGVGFDVIIDADAARAPFAEDVRLDRQRLQRRAIDLLQQLPARHTEPPDRTLFVEQLQEFADRRVDLGETVECSMAQPPEKPSLDDEHRLLDFGFVSRTPRPRRQYGGA